MIPRGENINDDVLVALISGGIACPCCGEDWARSSHGGAIDLKAGRLLAWEKDGRARVRIKRSEDAEQIVNVSPEGLWVAWVDEEASAGIRARLAEFGAPEPLGRVWPPACPAVAWASQPGWYPMRVRVLEWVTRTDYPSAVAQVRAITQDDTEPFLVDRVYWTEPDAMADR